MCSTCPPHEETQTFTPLFYSTVNQLLINLVPIARDVLLEMPGICLKFPFSSILVSNFCNPLNVHFFSGEFDYTMCSWVPYLSLYLSSSENGIVMTFFTKKVIITLLHKEHLTDFVKIKLLSVDNLTYSLTDIHWKFCKICLKTMRNIW